MPIPKIIHQTYKDEKDLPILYLSCQETVKNLHPEFSYRFYTDEDMIQFIQKEYPEHYDQFLELPRMIMKIDMFRYFLMYHFGGIYIDMDYKMFRSFDLLSKTVVLPANRDSGSLGNCIFASEEGHPFWKEVLDTFLLTDYSKSCKDENVIQSTGPGFLSSVYKNSLYRNEIFVPERELFHPVSMQDQKKQDELKSINTYGMHLCAGVWRNNQL